MGAIHGKNAALELDNAAGALQNIRSQSNNVDLSISLDTAETSAFGQGSKSYTAGMDDGTAKIDGMFDVAFATQIEGLHAAFVAGTIASATLVVGPGGSATGQRKYTQEVILTGFNIGTPVGDLVSISLDFQRTGSTTFGAY